MTFNILDHIVEQNIVSRNSSHLICICPVCQGKKLKISLSDSARGAYKCWTGQCTPSDIRKALGVISEKNAHLSPFRKVNKFSPFDGAIKTRIPPISLVPMKVCRLRERFVIARRGSVSPITGDYLEETIYSYTSSFRVLRVDIFSSEGDRKEKQVFIQKKENGIWIGGMPTGLIPLYANNLIFHLENPGNTIFFVEGEKVTEFLKREGYAAVTACTPKFNPESLVPSLKLFLFQYPFIQNVLIIPDNDDPGIHKADVVRYSCSLVGLSTSILFLEQVLQESLSKNFDLADTTPEQFEIFKNYIQALEDETQTHG